MSKTVLIKTFQAIRALSGLQDDVKNYKLSFALDGDASTTIKKVIVEEFNVPIPYDQNSENQVLQSIENGAAGTVVANSDNLTNPREVIISDGDTLSYEFNYRAYKDGNAGAHHRVLKAAITLSDDDELTHLITSKRRNTNPGTEGDVMHPPKP